MGIECDGCGRRNAALGLLLAARSCSAVVAVDSGWPQVRGATGRGPEELAIGRRSLMARLLAWARRGEVVGDDR